MELSPVQSLSVEARNLLGIELSGEALDAFTVYLGELEAWNQKVNLTAITDPREVVVKHFLDSLAPIDLIIQCGPESPTLVDVGSGAGFPGIPLKIACPGIRLTLVEARRKKVSFMSYLLGLLGIEARVVHGRAEDVEGTFDFVISRGFREPEKFMPLALDLIGDSGRVIMMLGRKGLDTRAAGSFGFAVEREKLFDLPFGMGERRVVLLGRVAERE